MLAIRTRYYAQTNTRSARITASSKGGKLTVRYNHDLDLDENHRAAALALAKKLGWTRWLYAGACYAHDWYWAPIVD